jgi:hypothetical protein
MRVSCGEDSAKWIRKGRWLAPEYYAEEMQNVRPWDMAVHLWI